MFILYDLIFLAVSLFYLPVYLLKRKLHRGFFRKLGFCPKDLDFNNPIWIHAVSVGEAITVRGLVEELKKAYLKKRLVISTVTATGNKIAQGMAKPGDFVTYLPLDFSFIVRCVIDKINPSLFILAETEIWPNLITYLYRKNIPIVVVNGRISDSSYQGYLCLKFLVKQILNKVNLFCVQTETDAQRLVSLGVLENKIKVTGNMKFDITDYTDLKTDYTDYRLSLGFKPEEKLWVCGSTHPGEEEIILGVYRNLCKDYSNLRLLIVPRHPERASEIQKIIIKYSFSSNRISQLNGQTGKRANGQTVFILDTVGELMKYYAIADIVFVGGSLIRKGGHNILEPASLGKPVLFGPYMFNFRDIADSFLDNNAGTLVHNKTELEKNIRDLLDNPSKVNVLNQRASELIRHNQGATKRNLEYIMKLKA
jgi:3-deoxy-D-manno-octulosonic-acid transferase